MTVYVLTAGNYSSYHIITVTLDKSRAEKLRNFLNKKDYSFDNSVRIEEYDTEAYAPDMRPLFRIDYSLKDNSIEQVKLVTNEYDYDDALNGRDWHHHYYSNTISAHIFAEDRNHAKKIFYDRLAQWKAKQENV